MSSRRTSTVVRAFNRDAINAVRAHLGQFSQANLQKAADRARVSVIRRAEPETKRDIRARYGIGASALTGKFRVSTGSDSTGDPYVSLWASPKRISLINFMGRWGGRRTAGATASVHQGQKKIYKSAFVRTINGHRGIYARPFKNEVGGARVARGPLRTLGGPSPFDMLVGQDSRNSAVIAGKLTTYYGAEIRRQLELLGSRK